MSVEILDVAMVALSPSERQVLKRLREGELIYSDSEGHWILPATGPQRRDKVVSRPALARLIRLDAVKCRYLGKRSGCEWRAKLPEEMKGLSDAARAFLASCREQDGVKVGGPLDDQRVSVPLHKKGLLRKELSLDLDEGGDVWAVAW